MAIKKFCIIVALSIFSCSILQAAGAKAVKETAVLVANNIKKLIDTGTFKLSELRNNTTISLKKPSSNLPNQSINQSVKTQSQPINQPNLLHWTGFEKEKYQRVKNEGLKSYDQLLKEGKVPQRLKLLPNQNQVIYFRPGNELKENTVGYKIDPSLASVHNQEHRAHGKSNDYARSEISLADYLKNKNDALELQSHLKEGETVLYDPFTGRPFITTWKDPRINDYRYLYIPEVTVKKDYIPPSELVFKKE